MEVNRIFICHAIRSENQQDIQKLSYLMQVLKRAGLEILTDQDDDSAERFFPLLQQKLLTCQAFILLQTPDAVSAPRVLLAVRAARRLAKQKKIQIFRFIPSLKMESAAPEEWKVLTTFDGTDDYKRTCEELVSAIAANSPKRNTTRDAMRRDVSSALPSISFLKTPSQTSSRWSPTHPAQKPTMIEKFLQSRKNTDRTRGGRNLLVLTLIPLVMLLMIGSIGTLFLRSGSKSTSPMPNPIVGQAFFIGSDQIGTDYNTGICDEIQVNLNHLTPPTAGKSYYAWLLPDRGHSEESPTTFLGPLTVNKGAASITYANPTHENLLLTKSRFLITEESASSPPSIPSPDQQIWRYAADIPQTPGPQDPHYSYLDHIRHLLAKDPTLQKIGMQGGLSTWFYENVKYVLEWADLAQGAGNAGSFRVARSHVISILDYLDGINFVAGDVPPETPIAADPQISRVPLLSPGPDPANQNPSGYIQHIETHLQGLADSPDATGTQRTLAGKIVHELDTINGLLEQVRQDAKQLVKMSDTQFAASVTASLLTDLVANANSAFVGQLDPANNTRQGGATWVHDVLPQLATLNVKVSFTTR